MKKIYAIALLVFMVVPFFAETAYAYGCSDDGRVCGAHIASNGAKIRVRGQYQDPCNWGACGVIPPQPRYNQLPCYYCGRNYGNNGGYYYQQSGYNGNFVQYPGSNFSINAGVNVGFQGQWGW